MPTNEKLVSFGCDPQECFCCYRPGVDTIDHIFLTGDFASNVWKFFAGICGMNWSNISFHHFIMRWWDVELRNEAHRVLLHSIPIFVCWNLWKNSCGCKYAGNLSSLARVKYLIISDTNLLPKTSFPHIHWPCSWKEMVLLAENCVHEVKIIPVQWCKPPSHVS